MSSHGFEEELQDALPVYEERFASLELPCWDGGEEVLFKLDGNKTGLSR